MKERKRSTLKRLPDERPERSLFGAIDTETEGLNGRLLFITAVHETAQGVVSTVEHFFEVKDLILWALMPERKKITWFLHNAEYDWRYFIPDFKEFATDFDIVPACRADDVIYQITFFDKGTKRRRLVLRDSMALYPASLKDFAERFSTKKKLDIGLSADVIFNPDNPDHVAYAERDVECLLESMINFDQLIYDRFNVHVKGTTASTAFAGFARTIQEGLAWWRLSEEADEFVRKGYYGGIVHIGPVGQTFPEVHTVDINSSYPAAMEKFGIPGGTCLYTREFDRDKPGFYRVICDASERADDEFFFIPCRTKDGVVWGRGIFETVITSAEIIYGEECGYKFKIIEGFEFKKIEFPFNEFVPKCRRIRQQNKGMPLETIAKLMQNSLYGKFGMKPDGKEYAIADECPDDFNQTISVKGDTVEIIEYLYEREVKRDSNYMLPHWSAWITAHARITIAQYVKICGKENFLYADTDSITCLKPGFDKLMKAGVIGNDYGMLKDEGTKKDWVCFAPKFYVFRDMAGHFKAKIKGIPKRLVTQEYLKAIAFGEKVDAVRWDSTTSLLAAFKSFGVMQVTRTRMPTDIRNSKGWEIIPNGTFKRAVPKKFDAVPQAP